MEHERRLRGEAFEWLAGLCLQDMYGKDIVIPQPRLRTTENSAVIPDFYIYDEESMDGEIYEVKRSPIGLDEAVSKYINAARSAGNCINSGLNVNIDTDRKRRINIIINEKRRYKNSLANHIDIREIAGEYQYHLEKIDSLERPSEIESMTLQMQEYFLMRLLGFDVSLDSYARFFTTHSAQDGLKHYKGATLDFHDIAGKSSLNPLY